MLTRRSPHRRRSDLNSASERGGHAFDRPFDEVVAKIACRHTAGQTGVRHRRRRIHREETDMAYQELKQRQSVMWGNGPYQRVTETLTDIHERVVERLDPRPGVRWLDLGVRHRRGRRARGGGRRERHRHRPRAGADRDRARARRRARPGDRLPGRRLRAARARGRELRRRLLDLRDHVLPRPRGEPRASWRA